MKSMEEFWPTCEDFEVSGEPKHFPLEPAYARPSADTRTFYVRDGKALRESSIESYSYTTPEVFATRSYKSTEIDRNKKG